MFYLTSKFHDDSVNTFGFIEGGAFEAPPPSPKDQELLQSPDGIGLSTILLGSPMHVKNQFPRCPRKVLPV